jgi:hypothetical protein
MKKNIIKSSIILFALFLYACGGETKTDEGTTVDVGQEIKDEIIEIETEAASMDSLKNEIDSATKEVDALIDEL